MSFVYVASPYTHEDPGVMERRYEAVMRYTAELIVKRVPAFSPIVHGHVMAQRHDMPKDYAFWREYARAMLASADRLHLLLLDGWEGSVGMADEVVAAHDLGLLVMRVRRWRECEVGV